MSDKSMIQRAPGALSALICVPVAVAAAGTAQAETRTSLDVSAGLTASNNPYLEAAAAQSGFGVSIEASPQVVFEGAQTTLAVTGNVRLNQYFERYGSDLGGSIGLSASHRASEKTTLRAGAGYSTSESGVQNNLTNQNLTVTSTSSPNLFIPDSTLIGQRARSHNIFTNLGVTFTPSARDSFTLDGGYNRFWSRSALARDYDNATLRAGYTRRLNDRVSAWVSVSGSRSNYFGRNQGDGTVITPMAGFSYRLNDRLTLSAGGGASISNIDDGTGVKRRSTALSVDASLCSTATNGNYCLAVQRGSQPTAFGGVQNVMSVSFNLTRRISDKNNIGLNAGYSRNDSKGAPGVGVSSDFLSLGANFTHRFNRRFGGFVAPHYNQVLRGNINRRADYGVTAGVRYTFGDMQ